MNPREMLEELDRIGGTIWFVQIGAEMESSAFIGASPEVPAELHRAILDNREHIMKLARWEHGSSPGMRVRKPRGAE